MIGDYFMTSHQLENCRNCGRLFLNGSRNYCTECYEQIESQFKIVVDFLRNDQNWNTTLDKLAASTGVPMKRIQEFLRDGRIFAEDYPQLTYPCSKCGKPIKKQVVCDQCFEQLSSEINNAIGKHQGKHQSTEDNEERYWRLKE